MASQNIAQKKKEVRKRIQQALASLNVNEISRQSRIVTQKALQSEDYKNARSLSIFLSMPGKEISTGEIVSQAFKDGKIVYIPYIHESKENSKIKLMDMLRLKDENDMNSLKPDAWGIPSLSSESVVERQNALGGKGCLEDVRDNVGEIPSLDLVFMPSTAFDRSLNRLGHGRGFYDRYLNLCHTILVSEKEGRRMPRLVGLALEQQILSPGEELPVTEEDWKVDAVLTAED